MSNCKFQLIKQQRIFVLLAVTFFLLFIGEIHAQTPTIKWWFDTKDASFGQSAAADIDGDGKLEFVFGCYRNDSCVYALNAEDGSLLWKYNTHPNGAEGCNDVAPIVYDIDGDSHLEVIVPSSCNPTTFCFDGKTGAVKWKCATRGSDSPPTIADLDNDGKPEILQGEFGGYVLCINAENGTKLWEIAVDTNSWIQTAPTIVDLNNDGQLCFVVGTWNFSHQDSIYAFRGDTHEKMWSFPVQNYMYHGTAVADLDGDNKPELLIGSYNDTLYCLNGENGTLKWKYFGGGGYCGAPAVIGDIDNDGICDVVFVSGYKVIALNNQGILKWSYSIPNYSGAFRGAVLADINNDEFLDVIFGTEDGKVIALSGNNGNPIWSIDLAAHYGNPKFAFDNAPLVVKLSHSSISNSDSLGILIVGGHAEYPNFQNDFGRAYFLSVGIGKGPEWLMFQHDILRHSSLCSSALVSVKETTSSNSSSIEVFPNPSAQFSTIKFSNPTNENYTFRLSNSFGQLIQEIENCKSEEIQLNLSCFSTGFYYFQLQNASGIVKYGKLIIE